MSRSKDLRYQASLIRIEKSHAMLLSRHLLMARLVEK